MKALQKIAVVCALAAPMMGAVAVAEDPEEARPILDQPPAIEALPRLDEAAVPDEAAIADQAAMTVAKETVIPENGVIEFNVYRKGDRIGTHTLTFTKENDQLTVNVDVNFKVRFLFVTVYRYEHEAQEIWRGGQLESFTSETVQNGKEWFVNARWNAEQMVVEAKEGTRVLDEFLFPTSYWNVASLNTPRWFNTQFGSPIDVTVLPMGAEMVDAAGQQVEATRYNISAMIEETQKPVDVWYDSNGELMKLQFAAEDGSLIEYKRVV